MSQIDTGPKKQLTKGQPDIYTVLALIGILALAISVGVVWYQNFNLTGNINPFAIIKSVGAIASWLVL